MFKMELNSEWNWAIVKNLKVPEDRLLPNRQIKMFCLSKCFLVAV